LENKFIGRPPGWAPAATARPCRKGAAAIGERLLFGPMRDDIARKSCMDVSIFWEET